MYHNLTITGYNVPPVAPAMTKIVMTNAGRSLIVEFDRATDKGINRIEGYSASFPCNRMFNFRMANESSCKWPTDQSVEIQFSKEFYGKKAKIGDIVTLLSDKITNPCAPTQDCSRLKYMPEQMVNISKPLKSITPIVLISTAQVIGACDFIEMDPSSSIGNAGRPWADVQWEVKTENVVNATTFDNYESQILNLLTAAYNDGDVGFTTIIPNEMLQEGGSYIFSLKLTNFLEQSAVSTIKVVVSSSTEMPKVKLAGVSNSIKYRWQNLNFFASATLESCNGKSRRQLDYSWKVYKDIVFEADIESVSLDKRYFRVPAYTFEALTAYTVQVVVTIPTSDGQNIVQSTASISFQVGASGVIPSIDGGSVQSVSQAYSFALNAASSYDVDYPDTGGLLNFQWNCLEFSPNFGADCPDFDNLDLVKTSSQLTIPSNNMAGGSSYNFSVVVKSSKGGIGTSSTIVSVLDRAIPRVSVLLGAEKYNADSKIVMSGTIMADPAVAGSLGVDASWSSVDGIVDLSSTALTPITKTYMPQSSTYLATFQLSLAANSLTAGLRYTFQLSAKYTFDRNSESIAYVDILTNEPPIGGGMQISPETGVAMNETYVFSTSKWADDFDDLPLQYTFTYKSSDWAPTTVLRSMNEVPFAKGVLGQGDEQGEVQYQITGTVACYDIYGAFNEAHATTIVNPLPANEINDILDYQLESAFISQDASAASAVISSITTALNIVDCVAKRTCENLNRFPCRYVTYSSLYL